MFAVDEQTCPSCGGKELHLYEYAVTETAHLYLCETCDWGGELEAPRCEYENCGKAALVYEYSWEGEKVTACNDHASEYGFCCGCGTDWAIEEVDRWGICRDCLEAAG